MTELNTNDPELHDGSLDAPIDATLVAPIEMQPTDANRTDSSDFQPQQLAPAFVTIERISGWIFTAILLCAGFVGLVIVAFSFGITSVVTGVCFLIYLLIAIPLVWATQVLPKKAYEHASWYLSPSGLEIRRGIWWRSQISVPLARVQHTDVHQGPLMRKYGLAKLIVHTAGTENSTVELNGLSFATAQRLRDALVENRGILDGV